MLNFTVGPVQSFENVMELGGMQIPYFRTPEFSAVMKENEALLKELAKAPKDARALFLTGSGTAAMEAAILNTLSPKDQALIINGGSFGQRFVQLCQMHGVPYKELKLDMGKALREDMLQAYEGKGITCMIVNVLETSTGVRYDMDMISRSCRKNGWFLIADAVSSFLADAFDMEGLGVNVMITASQKALACPPGVSMIIADRRAVCRIEKNHPSCMYLDLKGALADGERGQTPFTPAVGILLQVHERLKQIVQGGGAEQEIKRTAKLAEDFRRRIIGLPLQITAESLSNAVTPLHPARGCAYQIFRCLKEEYGIWVCPNGGEYRHTIFRVGHIGNLTQQDHEVLLRAFRDLWKRGMIRENAEHTVKREEGATSMKKSRIYKEKAAISQENTRNFYNQRALKLLGGGQNGNEKYECPYTSVLLGDQNPDYARQWNRFERNSILPKLNITKDCDVLDLGCGMGRWAEHVIPLCHTYCGADFSSEMIRAAEQRDYGRTGNYRFFDCSLQDFLKGQAGELPVKFNRLIIVGVFMYINDDELRECLAKLMNLFREDTVVYIAETVGLGQRLTLREFYSETLGCSYDAIYRTPEEYGQMFQVLKQNGCREVEQGFFPALDREQSFGETGRWYIVFEKKSFD